MRGQGKVKFIPAWHRLPIDKSPLLIVLHGRGDSMVPFLDFQKELGIPELNFILVNGHKSLGDGYAWCGLEPRLSNGILKTRNILTDLILELVAMGWRREKIFIFGFSEGALVATDFVMHSGQRIGGLIGVSGCVNFETHWKRKLRPEAKKTPVLLTHGVLDDVIFHDETLAQAQKLKKAGVPIEWQTYGKAHEIEVDSELPTIANWIRRRIY